MNPKLNDEERERIRAEEIFRDEVRKSLSVKRSFWGKVYVFFNSSLGVFVLSGVFLTGVSSLYVRTSEQRREDSARRENARKLLVEIPFRVEELKKLESDVFSYSSLQTVRSAITGKTINDAAVGQLGDFEPIFAEYSGRSLLALLWEYQGLLDEKSRADVNAAIAAAKNLASLVDTQNLVRVKARGNDDSQWSMTAEQRSQYNSAIQTLGMLKRGD